jgi:predicted DNA-binding WGR domain protein
LLDSYGVKVKRQNGAEITNEEIGEIKDALDLVYSVFGNRSSMAKNFGLKISHAGEKKMHARKACGLFFPSMKAIGVTVQDEKSTGFILAHEWAHFMDNYLGSKTERHYVSDDPMHLAGRISDLFRRNMETSQKSKYQNRTCECFARAMEQYYAIKINDKELLAQWNMSGNHPNDKIFNEAIYPLCEQFLQENEQLLKAFVRSTGKTFFFRKK